MPWFGTPSESHVRQRTNSAADLRRWVGIAENIDAATSKRLEALRNLEGHVVTSFNPERFDPTERLLCLAERDLGSPITAPVAAKALNVVRRARIALSHMGLKATTYEDDVLLSERILRLARRAANPDVANAALFLFEQEFATRRMIAVPTMVQPLHEIGSNFACMDPYVRAKAFELLARIIPAIPAAQATYEVHQKGRAGRTTLAARETTSLSAGTHDVSGHANNYSLSDLSAFKIIDWSPRPAVFSLGFTALHEVNEPLREAGNAVVTAVVNELLNIALYGHSGDKHRALDGALILLSHFPSLQPVAPAVVSDPQSALSPAEKAPEPPVTRKLRLMVESALTEAHRGCETKRIAAINAADRIVSRFPALRRDVTLSLRHLAATGSAGVAAVAQRIIDNTASPYKPAPVVSEIPFPPRPSATTRDVTATRFPSMDPARHLNPKF